MSLLVVGSVALDSVKTPFGEVCEALGGSATYFAVAASFFTDVQLVAVVGDDFPEKHLDFLRGRGIDLAGLMVCAGKTFRWEGEYGYPLSDPKTLKTDLNVFESFHPKLPPPYTRTPYLFLANIDPGLQRDVLQQVLSPKQVAGDTMDFWIARRRESLLKTFEAVDIVIINEGEARALSSEYHLVKAAKVIQAFGPKTLVVKRGEYGALMFHEQKIFSVPAYPLESVVDPTGAGDSFAGGFMGYLAADGTINNATLRQAALYGSVMASFCVEAFSLDRMRTLSHSDLNDRFSQLQEMTIYEYPKAG